MFSMDRRSALQAIAVGAAAAAVGIMPCEEEPERIGNYVKDKPVTLDGEEWTLYKHRFVQGQEKEKKQLILDRDNFALWWILQPIWMEENLLRRKSDGKIKMLPTTMPSGQRVYCRNEETGETAWVTT